MDAPVVCSARVEANAIPDWGAQSRPHPVLLAICQRWVVPGHQNSTRKKYGGHSACSRRRNAMAVKSRISQVHIGVLYGPPAALVFGQMVDEITRTEPCLLHDHYQFFCHVFSYISRGANVMWLNEECARDHCKLTQRDRYGFCCVIKHPDGGIVMYSRYPNYPF